MCAKEHANTKIDTTRVGLMLKGSFQPLHSLRVQKDDAIAVQFAQNLLLVDRFHRFDLIFSLVCALAFAVCTLFTVTIVTVLRTV